MKIPKEVKVGGHIVKVICPYQFKERSDLCGQYDHNAKVIRISTIDAGRQPNANGNIRSTFIHELLHAIDKTSGHNIFTENEPALEGITEGLYQVLVDNKGIFDGDEKED